MSYTAWEYQEVKVSQGKKAIPGYFRPVFLIKEFIIQIFFLIFGEQS